MDAAQLSDILVTATRVLVWVNSALLLNLVVLGHAKEEIEKRVAKELNNANEVGSNIDRLKSLSNYLEKLESELAAFFALSPDLLAIAKGGFFIKLNPSWENVLGWTREELKSKPYIEFIHPEDRPKTLDVIEQSKKSQIDKFRNRYLCKDGSYKMLSWAASTINENGETYAVARDVTEIYEHFERIELAKRTLQALADLVPVSTIILDPEGNCLFANRAWCERLGRAFEETAGKQWLEAVHETDREHILSFKDEVYAFVDETGECFLLSVSFKKVENDELLGYVVVGE